MTNMGVLPETYDSVLSFISENDAGKRNNKTLARERSSLKFLDDSSYLSQFSQMELPACAVETPTRHYYIHPSTISHPSIHPSALPLPILFELLPK